mgnify:CR=1 FL=1
MRVKFIGPEAVHVPALGTVVAPFDVVEVEDGPAFPQAPSLWVPADRAARDAHAKWIKRDEVTPDSPADESVEG